MMGPWRLELLRLWRTRRIVGLAGAFLLLGLGIPVLTYYLPDLIKNAGNGVQITMPKQTAADSLAGFASNIGQLGTLVVVVVAAGSLAVDANPVLATFYRTRIHRSTRLVLPRYVVVTVAGVAALVLGTLGAWYETWVLFGPVSAVDLMAGLAIQALWFCFVTAVVAVVASTMRGVLGVVGVSIGLLLGLGLLGNLPGVSSWLPTRLAGSGADFVHDATDGIWQATIVTVMATVAAVVLATYRQGQRRR
jgi:ABC-2 type transport system permease protein